MICRQVMKRNIEERINHIIETQPLDSAIEKVHGYLERYAS